MCHETLTLQPTRFLMPTMAVLCFLLFSFSNGDTQTRRKYIIQSDESRLEVQVRKGGLLKFLGHDHLVSVRAMTGHIELTEESITPAALQISIAADSLLIIDEKKEKDRVKIQQDMREKVLETAKYPQIQFESSAVRVVSEPDTNLQYNLRIEGDLTLHGVTQPIEIAASLVFTNDSLRAQGRFFLNQKNFRIKTASAAIGTVKVKDKLELSFDIVAR